MEGVSGGNEAQIVDAIVDYISQSETEKAGEDKAKRNADEILRVDFDTLTSYLESYIVSNEDVVVSPRPEHRPAAKPVLRPKISGIPKAVTKVASRTNVISPIPPPKPAETNTDFEAKLRETIAQYEAMLESLQRSGQDTRAIENVVSMMKAQLEGRVHKAGSVADSKSMSAGEKREKGLKEIFEFYCRQQTMLGKKPTFEQLEKVLQHMNLAEFMSFCKDFRVPIKSAKAQELFKRHAKLSKELDHEYFMVIDLP